MVKEKRMNKQWKSRRPASLTIWLLAWLLAVGPLIRPATVQAAGQASTQQSNLAQACSRTGPQYIFQTCVLPAPLANFYEADAISELLQKHELPPEDRARLLTWERDLIRATLFDRLLGVIQNPTLIDESVTLPALRQAVQDRRIAAADFALDQYNTWSGNLCLYRPPAGFTYNRICGQIVDLFGGPKPPSFEEFQAYGLASSYREFETNPSLIASAAATAKAAEAIKAYAFVSGIAGGAIIGSAIGSQLAASGLILRSIYPFLGRASFQIATGGSRVIASAAQIAVRGATTLGGVAAIVIAAVLTAVFEGIAVADASALPGKLQEAANTARNNPPDLRQMITTGEGISEFYATFLLMTMPDYAGGETLPGPQTASVSFRYFDGAGNPITQPGDGRYLTYKDWYGQNHTAWLTGGWLTDEYTDNNGVFHRRLTLDIDYINPSGEGWSAWRTGARFLHTRGGDDKQPFGDDLISYQTPSGANIVAQIILQLPETDLVVIGALNEGEALTFSTTYQQPQHPSSYSWLFPPDTNKVNGQTVQRTFAQSGTAQVRLEVETQEVQGQPPRLRTVTRSLLINNVPPLVQQPIVTPGSGGIPEGDEVTVAASFSDVAGDGPYTCMANFGDSSAQITGSVSGNTCTIRHTYLRKDQYKVTVAVTDKDGGTGISPESAIVTVVPSAPTVTNLQLGWNGATGRPFVSGVFGDADLDQHAVEVDWGDGEGYSQRITLPNEARTFQLEKSVFSNPSALGIAVKVRVFDWDELSDEESVNTAASAFTSLASATFGADGANSFTVRATGYPLPGFDIFRGTLPAGVTLTNNGDGTATFAGAPTASAAGTYPLTLRANNDTATPALQNFVLTITAALGFTSANQATFVAEDLYSLFRVTTAGFPRPADIRLIGTLPAGVGFTNYGDGEAEIGGQPAIGTAGVYNLVLQIVNPATQAVLVTQPFVLTVVNAYAFTSNNNDGFREEEARAFTVRTVGLPRAQLTVQGVLPAGITFVDNGDGTGRLSGSAAYRTLGAYPFRFLASRNGVVVAQQDFKLNILASRPPQITINAITINTARYNAGDWTNQLVLVTFVMRDQGRLNCSSVPNPTTARVLRATDGTGDTICTWEFQFNTEGVQPPIAVRAGGIDTGLVATATFGPIRIDKTAPETVLTSQTTDPSGTASFAFTGSDALSGLASFACNLDGSVFSACTSPQPYSGLSNGDHTFRVRAVDVAGNVDAEPASYTWTISTVPPTATPTNTPISPTPTNTLVPPTATPTNTPVSPTPTPTNTSVPPTPTNTPVSPTATPTPSGTLIGTCGVYTVYKNGNTYTAAGWTGTIKVGTNKANTLTGGGGRDLMLGLGGNDKLNGKAGDDVLCGGDGVDQLLGMAGNDYLDGGPGNDVLNGGTGDYDQLFGRDGNDALLDGDGVSSAQSGAGNDLFTLAVRNGWRDQNGQPRFTGVAAGYGNDTVALAILNLTRFFVDITGDERDNPPSPLEGTTDSLALLGVLDPASTIIKFERRLVLSAEAEATIPDEEAGAEYLTEPVGNDSEAMPEEQSPTDTAHLIFLPLVTSDDTPTSRESAAPIQATQPVTETTVSTPSGAVTTTSTALIATVDAATQEIQLYLPLVITP